MSFLYEEAKKELSWAVKHRRFLHKHPELSFKEKNTSIYCKEVMKFLGLDIKKSWGYGFTADLKVKNAKKTIAWRCEMDALAMDEKNKHSFVSKVKGVAHMCGHDAHMAISFLTAKLLVKHKDKLNCNVRFLFQPCEEVAPGGAERMIKEGCLDSIDEVYALHTDLMEETGIVRIKEGAMTANIAIFDVKIIGKGIHSALSHLGLDPLYAASNLVTAWQSIISRRIDPVHSASLSVTKFLCGTVFNVISDEAILSGTVRAFSKDDLSLIKKLMETNLKTLKMQGYSYNFKYYKTHDSILNKKFGMKRVVKACESVIDKKNIIKNFIPPLVGEDFGYYLKKRKGGMFFLGIKNIKKGICFAHHSPYFDVDEDSIALGAAIAAEIAMQA